MIRPKRLCKLDNFDLNVNSNQANGLVYWLPGISPYPRNEMSVYRRRNTANTTPDYGNLGGRQSLIFNGVNDVVISSDLGLPLGAEPRSFSAWIYHVGTLANDYAIINWGPESANNESNFIFLTAEKLGFRCNFNDADMSGDILIPQGVWIHVGAVYESGTLVKFYLDGKFAESSNLSSPPNTTRQGNIYVGSIKNSNRYFNGGIDDARVYSRALSDAEMWALYDPLTRYELWRSRPRFIFLSGGTVYTMDASGTITATGSLIRQPHIIRAGEVVGTGNIIKHLSTAYTGQTSPSGEVIEGVQTNFSGSVTPSGSLTLLRIIVLLVSGSVTAAGNLIRQVQIAYNGQITPSGDPDYNVQTSFSGDITPTGALSNLKTILLNLSGSVTPTSVLSFIVSMLFSGSVTATGNLIKEPRISFSGSVTPSGSLETLKIVLLSLAGEITPTGNLISQVGKMIQGAVTAAGDLIKRISTAYTGQITPSGDPDYSISTSLSGTVTPTGDLSNIKVTFLNIVGSITPIGNLIVSVGKLISASVTASSTLIKSITTSYSGQTTPSGDIDSSAQTAFSGSVTPTSSLSNLPIIGGIVTIVETLFKGMFKGMFKRMR